MSVRVSEENFDKEVLQSEIAVLADFYSDSCVPCKRLSPVLAEIEEESKDSLKVVKVNINFDGELAEKYEVQAAPTLILFRSGREVSRLRGAVKKAQITEMINTYEGE
ncbi:MAG: thioredoxin [Oscillospiraceae bacterium]